MQLTVEDDRTGMHSAAAISEGRRRADGSAGLTFRLVRAGEDHEAALTLAEAAHWESQFGYVPFDQEKTRRVVEQALAQDRRHLIAVAEVGGRVEGKWAKGIGAREILLHTTSGIGVDRVGRAVGRMGFEGVGEAYVAR